MVPAMIVSVTVVKYFVFIHTNKNKFQTFHQKDNKINTKSKNMEYSKAIFNNNNNNNDDDDDDDDDDDNNNDDDDDNDDNNNNNSNNNNINDDDDDDYDDNIFNNNISPTISIT